MYSAYLDQMTSAFEHRARRVRSLGSALYPRVFEKAPVQSISYRVVDGFGATENEAVDDWYADMPRLKDRSFDELIWRVRPEIDRETDFDTKQTRWRVYSRFAIIY